MKQQQPPIVFIAARCQESHLKRRGFTLRLEERQKNQWWVAEAILLNRETINHSTSPLIEIVGNFEIDPHYEGCPHCGSSDFLQCDSCGRVFCWNGTQPVVTCPWCYRKLEVRAFIERLAGTLRNESGKKPQTLLQ